MTIHLTDDGTLDTVLRCDECGEEFRFTNIDPVDIRQDAPHGYWREHYDDGTQSDNGYVTEQGARSAAYNRYVADCIEDVTADHVCNTDEDGAQ